MELVTAVNRVRYGYFNWRLSLSISQKLVMVVAMAAVTGLLAQVRLPLPFSPVPVTGQTLAVLLAGVLLGRWWGGASMGLYVGLGAIGLPWFSGWASGLGATGGYLVGFVLAALFLGHVIDKNIRSLSLTRMMGLMLFANFILIYVPGLIWLGLWLNFVSGTAVSLVALLGMGAVPFIVGDVTKAVAVAAIARGVTPGSADSGEAAKG